MIFYSIEFILCNFFKYRNLSIIIWIFARKNGWHFRDFLNFIETFSNFSHFSKGWNFFFIIYLFFQLNSIFCVFVAGSWSSFRNRIDDRTTIPRTQMRFNCIQGIVSGWSLKERVVCSKFGESQTHTHTCLVGWAELSLPWTHMQFFWTKRNCTMTNAINVSHPNRTQVLTATSDIFLSIVHTLNLFTFPLNHMNISRVQ